MSSPAKRDEPIRIFKSNFLEFFSHISPVAVCIVWIPLIALFLYLSIDSAINNLIAAWVIPVEFVGGLFLWTFIEYMLHRFLFHYHPKSEWGKRINFMFHGVHHEQPMVKTRLVMPPIVSIPLGAIVFGIYLAIILPITGSLALVNPLFAGTILGYLLYDMTHYATHHSKIKANWFKWIRSHHMKHHVATPDERFGVTTPIWDIVFGTEPKEDKKASKSA